MAHSAERPSGRIGGIGRLVPKIDQSVWPDPARRATALCLIALLAGITGLIGGIGHLWDGHLLRAAFTAAVIVPSLADVVLMARAGRIHPALHLLCAWMVVATLVSPFLSRLVAPVHVGLIAVPLVAAVLGGRSGLPWSAVVAGILIANAVWYPDAEEQRDAARATAIVATMVGIGISVMEALRERSTGELVRAREQAEQHACTRSAAERPLSDSQALFATAFRRAPSVMVLAVIDTASSWSCVSRSAASS